MAGQLISVMDSKRIIQLLPQNVCKLCPEPVYFIDLDGVRAFEDPYPAMAKAMGLDPKSKQDIPFRCGSDTFWNAYFDVLHKPYEKEGVDLKPARLPIPPFLHNF